MTRFLKPLIPICFTAFLFIVFPHEVKHHSLHVLTALFFSILVTIHIVMESLLNWNKLHRIYLVVPFAATVFYLLMRDSVILAAAIAAWIVAVLYSMKNQWKVKLKRD